MSNMQMKNYNLKILNLIKYFILKKKKKKTIQFSLVKKELQIASG